MTIRFTRPAKGENDKETTENLFNTLTMLIKQLEHIMNNPQGYFNTNETEDNNG